MKYDDLEFKIPKQGEDYDECSTFVIKAIEAIMKAAIDSGRNKIIINTNLKLGLPMENINKIAGPFVEAWAVETFQSVLEDKNNKYALINVEAKERLYMADVILQSVALGSGGGPPDFVWPADCAWGAFVDVGVGSVVGRPFRIRAAATPSGGLLEADWTGSGSAMRPMVSSNVSLSTREITPGIVSVGCSPMNAFLLAPTWMRFWKPSARNLPTNSCHDASGHSRMAQVGPVWKTTIGWPETSGNGESRASIRCWREGGTVSRGWSRTGSTLCCRQ